jgi:hypothetical protein
MITENRIISIILKSKGIGFIGVALGIILISISDYIPNVGISDAAMSLGILTIIPSSLIILASMVIQVVFTKNGTNPKFSIYGLVGLLIGSILLLFTWVILVIYGGFINVSMICYLIANAVILFSLGLPFLNLGGKPYILISILIAGLSFPIGYYLEFPSMIIASLVFPMLLMGIGSITQV